jgi:TPR repeat protein
MNEKNNFALVQRPSSAVEKVAPGAKRILSGMVADVQLENWFRTGEKYYNGWDVPQDYIEAVKWYRKAAEQNHAAAQIGLANCLICNLDYPAMDPAVAEAVLREATEWYCKAAEQGNAGGQFNLGFCYAVGQGVPKNFVDAYKFYKLAAEQNLEHAAEHLESIATRMSAVEIVEGERRVREFHLRKNLSK